MDARFQYVQDKAKVLLSAQGLKKLARNPLLIVRGVRQMLFDVKLTDARPEDEIRGHRHALAALGALSGKPLAAAEITDLYPPGPESEALAQLFTSRGSDKATNHNYYLMYAAILAPLRSRPARVLEIGLGTNNIDILSNMGLSGRPGASLRAFRDWLPQAQIFGADIDKRILFTEDRIRTFFVDQTDRATLTALGESIGHEYFDLIIDDGLHTPEANLNALQFALPRLAPGGIFVAEDVDYDAMTYWAVAAAVLGTQWDLRFIRCRRACVVMVRRA